MSNLEKLGMADIFSSTRNTLDVRVTKGDEGWLVVADSIGSKPCKWEQQKTYPQFLYGKQGKMTIWNKKCKNLHSILYIYINSLQQCHSF